MNGTKQICHQDTFPFVKLELFLNLQHVSPIFSSSMIKWSIACALTSFANFCVVDAMLTIMAKYADI